MPTKDQFLTNFGPIGGFEPQFRYADVNMYDSLFGESEGYYASQTKQRAIETAKKIDDLLDGFDIAVLFSLRRLYKITGIIFKPESADLIAAEMNSLGIYQQPIFPYHTQNSLDKFNTIMEDLRWHAIRQSYATYRFNDVTDHSSAIEIAEMTAIKNFFLGWKPEANTSNGRSVIGLVYSSVRRMIWANEILNSDRSVTFSDIASTNANVDLEKDVMRYVESLHANSLSSLGAEDAYILQNENEEAWQHQDDYIPEEQVILDENENNTETIYKLKNVQNLVKSLSLNYFFSAISLLPLHEQALALKYFGYISPEIADEQFARSIHCTTTDISQKVLVHLQTLLSNPEELPQSYPTIYSMICTVSNPQSIEMSIYQSKVKNSSIFELLYTLQLKGGQIPPIQNQEVSQLMNLVFENICYDEQGFPLRSLDYILQALSVKYGKNIDKVLARLLIKQVLIPVINGYPYDESVIIRLNYSYAKKQSYGVEMESIDWEDEGLENFLSAQQIALARAFYIEEANIESCMAMIGVTSRQAVYLRLSTIQKRLSECYYGYTQ